MKTSEKIEGLTCLPDGTVCFGTSGKEGDNAIMTEAIAEVKALEKENERLRAALQEIADYECNDVEEHDWPVCLAKEALEGE
jgi:hypothetical protein